MAVWTTPKTDWAGGDTPTASDFYNKVEENTQYLKDNRPIPAGGHFDNAGMEVQQDGSFADRWVLLAAMTNLVPVSTDTPNSLSNYSADSGLSVGGAGTIPYFGQKMLSNLSKKLVGQTIVVSGWVKITDVSNVKITLLHSSPSAADNWATKSLETLHEFTDTVAVGWNYVSHSYIVPASVGIYDVDDGYYVGFGATTTAAFSFNYLLSQPKLELGSTATDFIPNTYANELAASQPSFSGDLAVYSGVSVADTNNINLLINTPVTMRIKPTELKATSDIVLHNITTGGKTLLVAAGGTLTPTTYFNNQIRIVLSPTIADSDLFVINSNNTIGDKVIAPARVALDARL
jgi:hypothetical protein